MSHKPKNVEWIEGAPPSLKKLEPKSDSDNQPDPNLAVVLAKALLLFLLWLLLRERRKEEEMAASSKLAPLAPNASGPRTG